jgi:hypothetical protein
MATEPLLAVLLLRQLGFPPWQYGLAFAAPCVGGLIGSRLARRSWPATASTGLPYRRHAARGLADRPRLRPSRRRRPRHRDRRRARDHHQHEPVQPGARHLPARTHPQDRIARTLSAWSIGSSASIAIFTALGGLLADATSPRTAITVAGLLILASPLLLPRRVVARTVAARTTTRRATW